MPAPSKGKGKQPQGSIPDPPEYQPYRGLNMDVDLTLGRVYPFIDGVKSVDMISQMAKTDLSLTRKAIRHLLYYECIILLDIFQYGAIYAPTADLWRFVENEGGVQEEALAYVREEPPKLPKPIPDAEFERTATPLEKERQARMLERIEKELERVKLEMKAIPYSSPSNGSKPPSPRKQSAQDAHEALTHEPTTQDLVVLYCNLRQGLTLKSFIQENRPLCKNIDMRRFITFGVIKRFLYRVHKYAIAPGISTPAPPSTTYPNTPAVVGQRSGFFDDVDERELAAGALNPLDIGGLPLAQYLDGNHCFDEICTELHMSEKEVVAKMKAAYGDVIFFNK